MVLAANGDSPSGSSSSQFRAWRAAEAENDDKQTEGEGQKDLPGGR